METNLSRSGRSHPAGKMDSRIDVPVPDDLNDAVSAHAHNEGIPKAEFIRRILGEYADGSLVSIPEPLKYQILFMAEMLGVTHRALIVATLEDEFKKFMVKHRARIVARSQCDE